MTRTGSAALAFACCALGLATTALAWEPIHPSAPAWPGTVPYSLNERGSADLGGFAGTEAVVRQGFEDWTTRSCTGLTVEYRGSTASGAMADETVAWIESGWPEDANAIGVTGPSFDGSGRIVSAWMIMNGVHFSWTTGSGSGSSVNAYSITLHEAGHWMGLGHSGDPSATMYFAYSGGVSRLGADDEAGICTLYPGTGGGGTSTDCSTTGCPTGQMCEAGRCVAAPSGSGGTCSGCGSPADCRGTCLLYPDGSGRCGDVCAGDGDCGGDNEGCEYIAELGGNVCVRRDGAGGATCDIGPGTPPPGPVDPPPPTGCLESRDCGALEMCDASGTCVPIPTGEVGDACTTNEDCVSELCAAAGGATFCTALCDSTPCPAGFACVATSGVQVCSPDPGAPPDTPGAGRVGADRRIVGVTSCAAGGTGTGTGMPSGAWIALALVAIGLVRRRTRR